MRECVRKKLFDNWADQYDQAVSQGAEDFPFDGYDAVLSALVNWAEFRAGATVLDLGTGTGNLAGMFVQRGYKVWGIDFSEEMLKKAQAKYPEVTLLQADLLGDWPAKVPGSFDLAVSAYVLHEFDLASKLRLIQETLDSCVQPGGSFLVADIAFPSVAVREAAAGRWADVWDASEHYWAADESLKSVEHAGLAMQFQQISCCGGVFRFSKQR